MSDSIIALAQGIGAQADANIDASLTTGLSVITLIAAFLPLQQAWSKTLANDAETIYEDNLKIPGHPEETAVVAGDTQQKNIDSTSSDRETGNIDNIIQEQKAQAQILGSSMSQIYTLEEPVLELLRMESDLNHI